MRNALWIIPLMTLLLVGCAHQATVPIPNDTTDQMGWKTYYEDQFKAHGGKVVAPESSAPAEQRVAYQEARSSWKQKQVIGIVGGLLALAIGLGLFLSTLSQV